MKLEKFFYSQLHNGWVREGQLAAYLRKAAHYIYPNQFYAFLDIGSVEVHPDHRGQGYFKLFLNRCEEIAQFNQRGVYVENVLNPRLVVFLHRHGYRRNNANGVDATYYKVWPTTQGGDMQYLTEKQITNLTRLPKYEDKAARGKR